MPQDITDDKSTLVQVMAWCRQATSHYLNQCWPRSAMPYGITGPQWGNSSFPEQNGHFTHNIFQCIFMDTKFRIWIWISLKFVPKGPIDNKSALAQVMALRRTGKKPLLETMLTQSINAYIMQHLERWVNGLSTIQCRIRYNPILIYG